MTYQRSLQFRRVLITALLIALLSGCRKTTDNSPLQSNQLPTVALTNTIPEDPAIDSSGNDGLWNAASDDLGHDGLGDAEETGCLGPYDPATNPDPAFDNFDPGGYTLCPPDSGTPRSDPAIYTQNNGRPDPGEPHVTLPRPLRSALVKFDWYGSDADGFVTAFMYRWNYKERYGDSAVIVHPWRAVLTYITKSNGHLILQSDEPEMVLPLAARSIFAYFSAHDYDSAAAAPADSAFADQMVRLNAGDTILVAGYRVFASNAPVHLHPVHETPYSGNFIFESNDLLNRHTFEIRAVDNELGLGNIVSRSFWTRGSEPPLVEMMYRPGGGVRPGDTVVVLPRATASWQGVGFQFRALDRNSRSMEYSWSVDGKAWSGFTSVTSAFVQGYQLAEPVEGPHTFTVRARNEFGAITPPGKQASVTFTAIEPGFIKPGYPQRVLLVDANFSNSATNPPVMEYYEQILTSLGASYDIVHTDVNGHPDLRALTGYSVIYLITDGPSPSVTPAQIPGKRYADYLALGGSMIMNFLDANSLHNACTDPESLLVQRFGLRIPAFIGPTFAPICIGGKADTLAGYPDIDLDPDKMWVMIDTMRVRIRAFRSDDLIVPRNGSDIVWSMKYDGPAGTETGLPLGSRYLGPGYHTVWFGLPLVYVKTEQATQAIRKALENVGYRFTTDL